MKIETASDLIDYGPYNTWFDNKSDVVVMDIEDVIILMKEYAAQFIDLAAEKATIDVVDIDETENTPIYGVDVSSILNIKKQIK